MNDSPIFIHSLFRAGSTYLFNVFRRSTAGYWCYQEALHELAYFSRHDPKLLMVEHGEEKTRLLRHPQISATYFQELHDVWPAWKDVLSEEAIYDGYFGRSESDIGALYLKALVRAAKGRPVFQECRTSGRIGAIRDQLEGFHIYLWRNPWDEWWSYKVAPYFDLTSQLIINAPGSPAAVRKLRESMGLKAYKLRDLAGAFAYYGGRPLNSEESYLVFYTLWCLGLCEGMQHAHLLLNIDRLSDSPAYRQEVQRRLAEAGIYGIDLSDCHVPQGRYPEQDQSIFSVLEGRVHEWLVESGWSMEQLDQINRLRRQYQPAIWGEPVEDVMPSGAREQLSRAWALARRYETGLAERTRSDVTTIEELEYKAQQAEAKAQQAEAKAQQAEAKAQQAEAKAQQAEAASNQAEKHLGAMYSSLSWRITRPLRGLAEVAVRLGWLIRDLGNAIVHRSINLLQLPLGRGMRVVLSKPGLSYRINQRLLRYPVLHANLLKFAREKGLVTALAIQHAPAVSGRASGGTLHEPELTRLLTPKARRIYFELKAEIERKKQG